MEDRLRGVISSAAAKRLEADLAFSSTVRKIVLEVTEPLRGSKRIVNTDNFYTSVKLLSSLRQYGLYGRGTVKESSAHFPKAHMFSKKSDEERGSSLQGVCASERIVAASWRDGTTVNVISNADSSSMGEVTRLVGQVQTPFAAPACISEYNQHMQGVDRLDQLRAKYSIADGHSMQKWHLKLALAFIDMARVNAYVSKSLKENYPQTRNPHQDFMVELAAEMISGKWKDSVDDGGLFLAEIARISGEKRPPTRVVVVPSTPTTPGPSCTFVLSSLMFPDATRGKRGCKVCIFEGRTATMKTNYCDQHKICLCTSTYPILPKMTELVCPYADWNCWRKFHDYYLPRKLYNRNGNIARKSKLHLARRALDLSPSTQNLDQSDDRPGSSSSSVSSDAVCDPAEGQEPRFTSFTSLLCDSSSLQSAQHLPAQNDDRESIPRSSSSSASSDDDFVSSIQTSRQEPRFTSFTSLLCATSPHTSAPMTSPPTLVVSPFDGARANAALAQEQAAEQQQAAERSPHPLPATPGMFSNSECSVSFVSMTSDFMARSSVSTDFSPQHP